MEVTCKVVPESGFPVPKQLKSPSLTRLDSLSPLDLGPGTEMQSVRAGGELQASLFRLQAAWSKSQPYRLQEPQSSCVSSVPRFPHAIAVPIK